MGTVKPYFPRVSVASPLHLRRTIKNPQGQDGRRSFYSFGLLSWSKQSLEFTISRTTTKISQNGSPMTPRKRGRGKPAKATPDNNNNSSTDDQPPDTPSKKAKASPSKRSNPLGPIPATYDEASAADKLIIRLKEHEGKAWSEIKKTLEEFTGVALGGSTAHVRYGRMKANFVVFEKEDVSFLVSGGSTTANPLQEPALLESKKEIEDKFEIEKWQKIADAVEVKRGSKYPSSTVQKKFKELSQRAAAKNGIRY